MIAIAPAAYTDPETCGGVWHYRHPDDLVPTLDKYGAQMFANTIYDVAAKVPNSFQTYHSFQEEVYKPYLLRDINFYLEKGYLFK